MSTNTPRAMCRKDSEQNSNSAPGPLDRLYNGEGNASEVKKTASIKLKGATREDFSEKVGPIVGRSNSNSRKLAVDLSITNNEVTALDVTGL